MNASIAGAVIVAGLLAGCGAFVSSDHPAGHTVVSDKAGATAEIRDAGGRTLATAAAVQTAAGIRLRVAATAMRPGTYAVHLHPIGSCVPPTFDSAGKHWNPAGHQHGRDNPQGAHLGDLPNILIGANGRGEIAFTVKGASLSSGAAPFLDEDGGSILIHVNADDYRTDPSGNSGTKIACGVFRR